VRTKSHTLPKDIEQILAKSTQVAGIPYDTFAMLSKDMKLPTIKDESGKDVPLTSANYSSYMASTNRDIRKAAFDGMYHTLDTFQHTFAQTLSGQVKLDNYYASVRKYPSALTASVDPNNVPPDVYSQLITTVNKNLPLLHRYISLKKKILGLDELHMYDIYTPLAKNDTAYIPYDEAQQIIGDALKPLGDDYVKVLSQAFQNRWIDVYSTDDKQSGSYQLGVYNTHPYVLLNYQGNYESVSTIAHELGHAMQSYYTDHHQNFLNANYPIFTAEVASTLNETLLNKYLYAHANTKQEKMYLLNQYLENFRTTLFRQTQFAEFEKIIHEKEQAGESLNAEALDRIYLDLNKKYYGSDMVSDDQIAMEWARIPHFYRNFYVYQYATSFAASNALAKQVLDQGKPAVERIHDKFLSAGNSAPPLDVLKAAGIDMSSPEPIEQAMKVFEESLNELEKLSQ
jgi:oligoendopeptidase F